MKIRSKNFHVGDDDVDLRKWPTLVDPLYKSKEQYRELLTDHLTRLGSQQQTSLRLQPSFWCSKPRTQQAKTAAIKHVMSGVNPQGRQVFSFKHPSPMELHTTSYGARTRDLPERGRIGIFNRSYYEEVLIVRVHRDILLSEGLRRAGRRQSPLARPLSVDLESGKASPCQRHPRRQILLLHLSKEEQRKRFLARIDEPEKNRKFSTADVEERKF